MKRNRKNDKDKAKKIKQGIRLNCPAKIVITPKTVYKRNPKHKDNWR